jgi:ABC-type uncharacterized transport system substrate-binding protein
MGSSNSLAQPGGKITGVSWLQSAHRIKRLELFHEILPQMRSVVAVIRYV